MTKGIAYMPPHYTEEATIDPNPPAYESLTSTTTSTTTIIDEKQQLCRLSTEEQVPPHVSEGYNPNTGLDSSSSVPRRPTTVRKLEYKKAKKLLKAEKKYKDHLSKGKDTKYEIKMEKRAEKVEKWTEFMVKKSVGKHEKHVKKHGRCCDHVPVNQ
ncbi:hypothetical protein TWF703_000730 [Orbilia oligospora]|uniref:Uncharacterized protein n=1 Tax=Orbilia oligospora TaxID=2813651 RepID=A0A7C8NIH8_ORBOL|nr:hypothetical protein TWF703_000730 [Orbilia oligospora]